MRIYLITHLTRFWFFVAESDLHYSPARIAGLIAGDNSDAESVEQFSPVVAHFQRAARVSQLTRRSSPGYNVGRLWRHRQKNHLLRKVS